MNKKALLFCLAVGVLLSCSDNEGEGKRLTAYEESVIELFADVALGFEFGGAPEITRKWTSEMKIFVGGQKSAELIDELNDIVDEINGLTTDGFKMSIVNDTLQSNFYIFLGSGTAYAEKFPSLTSLIDDNWGLFSVYWDVSDQIYRGHMYVDVERANPAEEKHLLREELTQSLGLAKDTDSDVYLNSIFQSEWTTTTEYADIDKDLIRLLYHPQMQIGLAEAQLKDLLTEILLSERP